MWQTFIKKLLTDFRTSTYELEKAHGISSATLSYLLTGKTKKPNQTTIQALERALNIRIDDTDIKNIRYIILKGEQSGLINTVLLNEYPLLSHIHAGSTNMIPLEQTIGRVALPYHKTDNVYAIRIEGDSMTGIVDHGEIVLVDCDASLHNGCIVAVKLKNGGQYIKKYSKQDKFIVLSSNNNNHPPMVIRQDQIDVIYRVVKIVRNV